MGVGGAESLDMSALPMYGLFIVPRTTLTVWWRVRTFVADGVVLEIDRIPQIGAAVFAVPAAAAVVGGGRSAGEAFAASAESDGTG